MYGSRRLIAIEFTFFSVSGFCFNFTLCRSLSFVWNLVQLLWNSCCDGDALAWVWYWDRWEGWEETTMPNYRQTSSVTTFTTNSHMLCVVPAKLISNWCFPYKTPVLNNFKTFSYGRWLHKPAPIYIAWTHGLFLWIKLFSRGYCLCNLFRKQCHLVPWAHMMSESGSRMFILWCTDLLQGNDDGISTHMSNINE